MFRRFISGLAVLLVSVPAIADDADLKKRIDASRAASAQLLEALKAEVTKAAQAKGAPYAIGVCNLKALPITAEVSKKTGMEVGRTSHKIRNPKNAPDAWEEKVLADFQKRKANGEDLKTMEHYEVLDESGEQVFRYMKAIPLGGVCYNCHGDKLRPEVMAKLDELYPDDQARGFVPGDLRGAFTVRQKMK